MSDQKFDVYTEVWNCNNEIFFTQSKIIQTEYEKKKKYRHHKRKFFMIPIITFFIVETMFGNGKVYEYKYPLNYTVVEGDTLWDISRRYLGKGYKYLQIVIENEIENPDLIYSGETYQIVITDKIKVDR